MSIPDETLARGDGAPCWEPADTVTLVARHQICWADRWRILLRGRATTLGYIDCEFEPGATQGRSSFVVPHLWPRKPQGGFAVARDDEEDGR